LAGSEWYLAAMAYMESQVGVIVFADRCSVCEL
jgi:hypothetical protein